MIRRRTFTEGKKVTVSIRMTESLKKELDRMSKKLGHKLSDYISEGLDQWASIHKKHHDR